MSRVNKFQEGHGSGKESWSPPKKKRKQRRKVERCNVCGSDWLATNGWCITCKYGDSPYH